MYISTAAIYISTVAIYRNHGTKLSQNGGVKRLRRCLKWGGFRCGRAVRRVFAGP